MDVKGGAGGLGVGGNRRRWWGGWLQMGLGDDEEKGRRENVMRMRGWELCEKGWRLRGSCSLMAFFFSGARGWCDDVRVDGWVALIF